MVAGTTLPCFATNAELEHALASRREFLDALRAALEHGNPFAAGKIGNTEQHLLSYYMLCEQSQTPVKTRMLEMWLKHYAVAYAGLFPPDTEFYFEYGKIFRDALYQMDFVGLFRHESAALELELVNYFGLRKSLTRFQNLHPDRSIPDDASNCYLPFLRDKKILLVCPFGNLLASRATREIFEGVWRVSGKKFFEPARVEGLEFPYGFARETWTRYATCLDLLDEIQNEIARRDFDVALIGAGGMGIPLAAFVKRSGKIGIMLGGHLQVLFGVKGARWKKDPTWRDTYFNEWWIDMPESYRPKRGDNTGDASYW